MASLRVSVLVSGIAFACVGGCRHRGEESGSESGAYDDGACDCVSRALKVQCEATCALWTPQVSSYGVA